MIGTDKQQDFEILNSFQIISLLIKGLEIDPTLKISHLIKVIEQVTLIEELLDEPQDWDVVERIPLTQSVIKCFESLNKYFERQQILLTEMQVLQNVKQQNSKQLAEFDQQIEQQNKLLSDKFNLSPLKFKSLDQLNY